MSKYILAGLLAITLNTYSVIVNLTILKDPINNRLIYIYSDVHQPANQTLSQAELINKVIKKNPQAKVFLDSYSNIPLPSPYIHKEIMNFLNYLSGSCDVLFKCHDMARSNNVNIIDEDLRFRLAREFTTNKAEYAKTIEKLISIANKLQEKKLMWHDFISRLNSYKINGFKLNNMLEMAANYTPDVFDAQCLESILLNASDSDHIIVCGLVHSLKIFDYLTQRTFNYEVIYNSNKKIENLFQSIPLFSISDSARLILTYTASFWIKYCKNFFLLPSLFKSILSFSLRPAIDYKNRLSEGAIEDIFGIANFDDLMVPIMFNKNELKALRSNMLD